MPAPRHSTSFGKRYVRPARQASPGQNQDERLLVEKKGLHPQDKFVSVNRCTWAKASGFIKPRLEIGRPLEVKEICVGIADDLASAPEMRIAADNGRASIDLVSRQTIQLVTEI